MVALVPVPIFQHSIALWGTANVTLLGQLAQTTTDASELDPAQLATPQGPIWALLLAAVGTWVWAAWRLRRGQPPLVYADRRPVPWRGFDVAIVLVAGATAISLCQGAILHFSGAVPTAAGNIPDEVLAILFVGQSISEVCLMLFAVGLLMWRCRADWADLGLDFRKLGHDLGIGLIGFLFSTAPVMLLFSVLQSMLQPKEMHPLIEFAMRQPSQLWLIGLCAVLVAPLVEEFFFRVILQGWLESVEHSLAHGGRLLPSLPIGLLPIVISSFLFAAVHGGQGPAPVPLFFLALVLGYLYHQTHRLLPSLMVHALFNGTTFLALWWSV
jgi:membrane protease YdiL (CAAX protease family)